MELSASFDGDDSSGQPPPAMPSSSTGPPCVHRTWAPPTPRSAHDHAHAHAHAHAQANAHAHTPTLPHTHPPPPPHTHPNTHAHANEPHPTRPPRAATRPHSPPRTRQPSRPDEGTRGLVFTSSCERRCGPGASRTPEPAGTANAAGEGGALAAARAGGTDGPLAVHRSPRQRRGGHASAPKVKCPSRDRRSGASRGRRSGRAA